MQVNDGTPASAAPIAALAISSGVTGRWDDMEGVWIAPVTAQVTMTLRVAAMTNSILFLLANILVGTPLVRAQRHQAAIAPALPLGQPFARLLLVAFRLNA